MNLVRVLAYLFLTLLVSSCARFSDDMDPEKNVLPGGMSWRLYLSKKDSLSQGMSIWNNSVFVAHDGGLCDVYDYTSKQYLGSFGLASSRDNSHCNCLNFGLFASDDSPYPLLYVSNGVIGAEGEWRCNVEAISVDGSAFSSELVQTITLDSSDFSNYGYHQPWGCPQWLVDSQRSHLWVWSADLRTIPSVTGVFINNCYHATCFRIPELSEGENIILTASDVQKQVSFEFDAYATQGGCMYDGIIYYSFGFGYQPTSSKIRAYNTDSGKVCLRLDLNGVADYELEDLALYDGKLFVNTNTKNIYAISNYTLKL